MTTSLAEVQQTTLTARAAADTLLLLASGALANQHSSGEETAEQQNISIISVTASTSKMYFGESGGIPHLFGAPASQRRPTLPDKLTTTTTTTTWCSTQQVAKPVSAVPNSQPIKDQCTSHHIAVQRSTVVGIYVSDIGLKVTDLWQW